jgi:hypothetical protein
MEGRRDGKHIFQEHVMKESASFRILGRDPVSLAVLKLRF